MLFKNFPHCFTYNCGTAIKQIISYKNKKENMCVIEEYTATCFNQPISTNITEIRTQ